MSQNRNEILQNDCIQQHQAMEKQRKKYVSELKSLRGRALQSENEQVNEKNNENQRLLKTNSMLSVMLEQAKVAKERMEANLLRVYDEAHEVRACLLYTSPSPRDATLSRMPSSA